MVQFTSAVLALAACFAPIVLAAPAPQATSSETTPDVITRATVTYTFPNLVPAGTVNMAIYSTATDQPDGSDLPIILKREDDPPAAVISNDAVTYTMPNLAPAGTVDMAAFTTGGQPATTGFGAIAKN